ncbi:MAG: aldo/keto reductase [Pseudomonadales bacterium]|jgi:aryl-alcohol dehydrogenase-like predicted oxidoreductase|tara:strand:+ start:5172 stop:6173 length:1002 start_codon:yes stop_codon:yes gene_type:complete
MKKTELGNSGVFSSILGFGCMGMSEFYGQGNEADSLRTLERAYDLGVTHFDTSDVYGRGENERLVGRFARGKCDKIMLSTKFGVSRDPEGPQNSTYDREINNSPDYMRQCCDESLRRLGRECIDLYYVHRVDPAVPIENTIGALADLVQEGKIRAIGLSEVSGELLQRACDVHPIAALQSEYSLWSREVESEILPLCTRLGVTFVAYSPLGRGFLSGAINSESDLEPDDIRRTLPRFRSDNLDRNRRLLQGLKKFADGKGISLSQLALAFILRRRERIIPIPGTKRVRYLEENVASTEVTLSDQEIKCLEELMPVGIASGEAYDSAYGGAPKS